MNTLAANTIVHREALPASRCSAAIEDVRAISHRKLNLGVYLFFSRGGIARYTHEVLRELAQNHNLQIELACDKNYRPPQAPTHELWTGLTPLDHPWPICRRARFLAAQFRNPDRMCRRADERRFDLLHFSDFNHLTYPLWRNRIRRDGRKIVATVHDVRRAKSLFHHGYENAQLCRFYREADALFVHTRAQASELADWAGVDSRRMHVVPHGPFCYGEAQSDRQTLRTRYQLPRHKQLVLSFGNLRDDKNLARLIRALPRYRNRVHLVVAGRGASRGHLSIESYARLCAELGVADSVTFLTRYLNDSEVSDLFTACDWVALPYSRSFTSQSGVLSVAARYHRPVLASNIPAFRESMTGQDIGLAIEPDDDDALALGVQTICDRVDGAYPFRFDDYLSLNSWATNARITADVYAGLIRPQ